MAKGKSGYTFKDSRGNWYARITTTDANGKRHQSRGEKGKLNDELHKNARAKQTALMMDGNLIIRGFEMTPITTEGAKLSHDTYKHLTTLSSGSILVIATFLARGDMRGVGFAVAALVCLLICNLFSVLLMFGIAQRANGELSGFSSTFREVGQMLTLALFQFGLLSIIFFATRNFFN